MRRVACARSIVSFVLSARLHEPLAMVRQLDLEARCTNEPDDPKDQSSPNTH